MAYPDYVVWFRGRRACPCLAEWLPVLEKEAIRQGIIKRNLDIAQLIGGVAASGGTHTRGGAFDVWQTSAKFVRLCRDMGADASWHRLASQGPWSPHTHGVLRGCPHNLPARYQITGRCGVDANKNGLGTCLKDPGPRPLSGRTWKEGIAWAKRQGKPPAPAPSPLDKLDPKNYGPGQHGSHITWLGERLVVHGFGEFYDVGPGPTWGAADKANVQAFQRANNLARQDGYPDRQTLELLAGDPQVTPNPPALEPHVVRGLNINVCADYCANFAGRVDNIELVRADARASLVWTTEAGPYADGERLNREFGWGGHRAGDPDTPAGRASFVLHGDSVPICTALHWDPDKYRVLDEGMFVTLPGSTHRWGTWVLLEHLLSRGLEAHGITHLQYLPKGPNTVKRYEVEKFKQLDSMLRQLDIVADAAAKTYGRPVPRACAGDFNSTRKDKFDASDGVGKAIKGRGYQDAAVVAATHVNGNAPQIDRVAVKGWTVDEHGIYPTRGGTDHTTAVGVRLSAPK